MTRSTRTFVVCSSLLLSAGLGVGAVAYYGSFGAALASSDGLSELSYVPSDVAVVAFADVREVMASDFRQQLLEAVPPASREHGSFKDATGVDIEHDIDRVVAASLPAVGRHGGFAALRGRFDPVRLEALARGHGGEVVEYRGQRILRLGTGNAATPEEGRRPALAFAEPGLVLVGDEFAVRRAIDTHAGGPSVRTNADLMSLVSDVDAAASAWAVGHFDALIQDARLPRGMTDQVPPVEWFAASASIDGGVSGVLRADARDDQSARNLLDLANGLLALARLQSGGSPEMQALVQGIRLSGSGKRVELAFTLPPDALRLLPRVGRDRALPLP